MRMVICLDSHHSLEQALRCLISNHTDLSTRLMEKLHPTLHERPSSSSIFLQNLFLRSFDTEIRMNMMSGAHSKSLNMTWFLTPFQPYWLLQSYSRTSKSSYSCVLENVIAHREISKIILVIRHVASKRRMKHLLLRLPGVCHRQESKRDRNQPNCIRWALLRLHILWATVVCDLANFALLVTSPFLMTCLLLLIRLIL